MSEISDIMSTDVISITSKSTIFQAIDLLLEHNITGLPVVDKKTNLIGVVSEKDLLMLVHSLKTRSYNSNTFSQTIESVMTKETVSFDINDRLSDICRCLMENDFRRVPILSKGKLVGIISRKDLLRSITTMIDATTQSCN